MANDIKAMNTALYIGRHADYIAIGLVAGGLSNPVTRSATFRASKYTAVKILWPYVRSTAASQVNLVKNIAMSPVGKTLGYHGAAAAATAVAAVPIGIGVSGLIWGDSGIDHAKHFYSGKVSFKEWQEAVSSIPRHFIPDLSSALPWN
jgi:sulfite exporter TauE/SafE